MRLILSGLRKAVPTRWCAEGILQPRAVQATGPSSRGPDCGWTLASLSATRRPRQHSAEADPAAQCDGPAHYYDYFDKGLFQWDKFKTAIGAGKQDSISLKRRWRTRLILLTCSAPPKGCTKWAVQQVWVGYECPVRVSVRHTSVDQTETGHAARLCPGHFGDRLGGARANRSGV